MQDGQTNQSIVFLFQEMRVPYLFSHKRDNWGQGDDSCPDHFLAFKKRASIFTRKNGARFLREKRVFMANYDTFVSRQCRKLLKISKKREKKDLISSQSGVDPR